MRIIVMFAMLLAASAAFAQSPVERGRYLVETIAGCGNCHTPQGPNGPIPGKTLAGGNVLVNSPEFTAVASNITQDKTTGIGAWTDQQIALAIREGKRPDGSLIGPPMPIGLYRGMADADLAAIVAFLRTVPAIENKAAKSAYRIPLPPAYGPPVGSVTAPPKRDLVAYGAYLAGPVGHCIECHSPMLPGGRTDITKIGAGGMQFPGPWGTSVAANITPSKTRGLGDWTDAQIDRAIRTGVSADGRKLFPPMGFAYYRGIAADDMAALIAWMRALAPMD
ncbi:MAG: c-type cytochrome [Alphaproteobacteria bacterium]|nr:c-type cytochrome [Alphaproteobacteria bacterium]